MSLDPTIGVLAVIGAAAFVADAYLLGVRPAARDALKDAEDFHSKHLAACQSVLKGVNFALIEEIRNESAVAVLLEPRPSAGTSAVGSPKQIADAAEALNAVLGRYRTGAHVHDSLGQIKKRGAQLSSQISIAWGLGLSASFLGAAAAALEVYAFSVPAQVFAILAAVCLLLAFVYAMQWSEADTAQTKARSDLEKELETRFYFAASTAKPDLSNPPAGPAS